MLADELNKVAEIIKEEHEKAFKYDCLVKRINKAIEYIEDETHPDYERELCSDMYDVQIFELLKILRGEA